MAIEWPWPNLNSSFNQFTISPAFTSGFSLPRKVNPFFSASLLKSLGLLPVLAWMLSRYAWNDIIKSFEYSIETRHALSPPIKWDHLLYCKQTTPDEKT